MPSHLGRDSNAWSRSDLERLRRPTCRPSFGVEALERRLLLSDAHLGLTFVGPLPLTRSSDSYTEASATDGPGSSTAAHPTYTYATFSPWRTDAQLDAQADAASAPFSLLNPPRSVATSESGSLLSESNAPHGTLYSAQSLPYVQEVRLAGTLDPSDRLDLYRIPIDSDTLAVQITLRAISPSMALPGRIWLLDESGHIAGDWPIPKNTHTITLTLRAISEPLGASIIYGISHGTGSKLDPSAPVFNYEVQVTRASAPGPAAEAQEGPIVTLPPPSSLALAVSPGNATEPTTTSHVAEQSASAPQVSLVQSSGTRIDPSQLETGPLPARSAGPSGGWFADGDPIPPLDRFDAALADLKLIDILPPANAPSELLGNAEDQAEPDPYDLGPPLVTLQSAGGFPLLAATLSESFPTAPSATGVVLPPVPSDASAAYLAAADVPFGACKGDAPANGRPQSDRRRSVVVTLNIAATLAFGLLLPDLVAALQGVEPRRPLPRILLPRRPWKPAD